MPQTNDFEIEAIPNSYRIPHDFGEYVATVYVDPSGLEFADHLVVKVKSEKEITYIGRLIDGKAPVVLDGWKPSKNITTSRVPTHSTFMVSPTLNDFVVRAVIYANQVYRELYGKFLQPVD